MFYERLYSDPVAIKKKAELAELFKNNPKAASSERNGRIM
jgi:hypothetical protein